MRGMNGMRAVVGASASRAAPTAASPIAWIWVAIPPAAAFERELRELRLAHEHEPAIRRAFPGLDERSRLGAERSVGEELQPAHPNGARGIPANRRAAREPFGASARQASRADAGFHEERQIATIRDRAQELEIPEVRINPERTRIMNSDDPVPKKLLGDSAIARPTTSSPARG